MKKLHIALIGGAVLVVAFLAARHVYESQRAEEIASLTQTLGPPLVRDHAQSMGSADAKVVIVEFFDPGCETCRRFAEPVKQLLAAHPGKIRLVLRYAPFHEGADTMVKILEAARKQDKYWETLHVMYETQPLWASHHHPEPDKIWDFLPATGLDLVAIKKDMNTPEILKILKQDVEDAKTLNVRGTPGFFVNGKPLPSFGLRQLQTLVSAEIAASYGE